MAGEQITKQQAAMDTREANDLTDAFNSQDPRIVQGAALRLYNDITNGNATSLPDARSMQPMALDGIATDLLGALQEGGSGRVSFENDQKYGCQVTDLVVTEPNGQRDLIVRFQNEDGSAACRDTQAGIPQGPGPGPAVDLYDPLYNDPSVSVYIDGLRPNIQYGYGYDYDRLSPGYYYGANGAPMYDQGLMIEWGEWHERHRDRHYGDWMREREWREREHPRNSDYGEWRRDREHPRNNGSNGIYTPNGPNAFVPRSPAGETREIQNFHSGTFQSKPNGWIGGTDQRQSRVRPNPAAGVSGIPSGLSGERVHPRDVGVPHLAPEHKIAPPIPQTIVKPNIPAERPAVVQPAPIAHEPPHHPPVTKIEPAQNPAVKKPH